MTDLIICTIIIFLLGVCIMICCGLKVANYSTPASSEENVTNVYEIQSTSTKADIGDSSLTGDNKLTDSQGNVSPTGSSQIEMDTFSFDQPLDDQYCRLLRYRNECQQESLSIDSEITFDDYPGFHHRYLSSTSSLETSGPSVSDFETVEVYANVDDYTSSSDTERTLLNYQERKEQSKILNKKRKLFSPDSSCHYKSNKDTTVSTVSECDLHLKKNVDTNERVSLVENADGQHSTTDFSSETCLDDDQDSEDPCLQ